MWSLAGSQAFDKLICSLGTVSLGWQVHCFGPVSAAASLCCGYAPIRGFRCGCPAGVSGVGGQLGFQLWAPSPLIGCVPAGGQVSAGLHFSVHSPGSEGGGAPEAAAAVESSLTSC